MKRKMMKLLTMLVTASLVTAGIAPVTGFADDIVAEEDYEAAEGGDEEAAYDDEAGEETHEETYEVVDAPAEETVRYTAEAHPESWLTQWATVPAQGEVTGSSGAFDGTMKLTVSARDLFGPLYTAAADLGGGDYAISNPDEEPYNQLRIEMVFPEYVQIGGVSADDELSSMRIEATGEGSTVTLRFILKDEDVSSFMSHYRQDIGDADGDGEPDEDLAGLFDTISIDYSGDAGSGTSFEELASAVEFVTPDYNTELLVGNAEVAYSFSGRGALVQPGEEELPDEVVSDDETEDDFFSEPENSDELVITQSDEYEEPEVIDEESGGEEEPAVDVIGESEPAAPVESEAESQPEYPQDAESTASDVVEPEEDPAESEPAESEPAESEPTDSEPAAPDVSEPELPDEDGSSEKEPSQTAVIYQFVPEDETMTLPAAVNALLPVDDLLYVEGEVVRAEAPAKDRVETEEGFWVFLGYDADEKTVGAETVVFTGTWSFAAYAKYLGVSYSFKSADGSDLPQTVLDLLPSDEAEYEVGTTVQAQDPKALQVKVDGGLWIFDGYEQTELVIEEEAANTFIGTWSYSEDVQYYTVTYGFEATDGSDLPQAVLDLLPSDDGEYEVGTTVKAKDPAKLQVKVDGGLWIFDGYDQTELVIEKEAANAFVGTWSYTEDQKYGTVVYSFRASDDSELPEAVKSLLPESKDYPVGTTVKPETPSKTSVDVEDGTWSFDGYEDDQLVVEFEAANVFIGVWSFKKAINPDETISLKVVKIWADNSNEKQERPNEITVRLYKNGEKYQSYGCSAPADASDTWTYTLRDLPKYENGKEISWTIDEADVKGYWKSIDGFTITNTYGTRADNVKTGDTSPILRYVLLAAGALVLIILALLMGRKKK